MFDFLEQLELFAACFLQLRRTLVDLIQDRLSFIADKNSIILLFCTQIPAITINILLCSFPGYIHSTTKLWSVYHLCIKEPLI